ncbi:acyl-CoA thioesterase [Cryomorpha ignava]|uniref:Acyl-CoA thioesterase n=1 Tax=Cryomorpha ignava TaxID=101383 RepID=A0A7K3WNZ3_9FLAO|nr:thioesterase family protein [Cryomorpha ignava]NEN23248.1 acyl-CoA thioesterase [Cryomorpha ignava]
MVKNRTELRVRYAETDQMGYVYYGNYAAYYEVGRVELMRQLGTSYRQIEESGLMLPVRDFSVRYFKPALYDDLITVETRIEEMPTARIKFNYDIFNENADLLTSAETTLVFVSKETNRPVPAPKSLLDALNGFFE